MVDLKETHLAIVLLDIIGSTAFVQQVGARKAAVWLQYHDRLARSLLYKFEGREIDRSDGFLMSFQRPIDAVNFGLLYQQTIPIKTHLHARIGIHYGSIIEVTQDDTWTAVGAKRIELEGISKNIAARTMSICEAGQVLLTSDALEAVKGATNIFTPRGTRYVMIGLYRFKGVGTDQTLYAVGNDIKALQPPKGNDKAKRLGGPRKVRSRARDRKVLEWIMWILPRLALINLIYIMSIIWPWLSSHVRWLQMIIIFLNRLFYDSGY